MLWLRETWFRPGDPPYTLIVAADGLKDDIHVVADQDRRKFGRLIDVEIFEWEDNFASATLEAARRSKTRLPEKTHLMDTLHDHLIVNFIQTRKETVITLRSVVPLEASDIRQAFLAAIRNRHYKGQIVSARSKDGKEVMIREGEILVRD